MREKLKQTYLYKHKTWFIILFFIYLIPALCFFYEDSNSIARQGMNVWTALFNGRFLEYYSFNVESVYRGEMRDVANYDMLLNVLIGIWHLPLYIAERIRGGNILDLVAARTFSKLLPVVFTFLSGYELRRLGKSFGLPEKRTDILYILFMTGTFVLIPCCMVGQVDSMGAYFLIIAVCALKEKKTLRFIIFGTLAVQCKSFGIFVFLPLYMLVEKRLSRLIPVALIPVIASRIIQLPFSLADPAGAAAKRPRLWILLDYMTRTRIDFMGVEVPILFILLGVVMMAAYYIDCSEENRGEMILYFAACSMLPMILSLWSHPQWMMYMYPFLITLICAREDKLFRRLLYETAATFSLTAAYIVSFSDVFGEANMKGMLIEKLFPTLYGGDLLVKIVERISDEKYLHVWKFSYAVFAVWIAGCVIMYCPLIAKRYKDRISDSSDEKYAGRLLYLRAVCGFVLCSISLFLYFV